MKENSEGVQVCIEEEDMEQSCRSNGHYDREDMRIKIRKWAYAEKAFCRFGFEMKAI